MPLPPAPADVATEPPTTVTDTLWIEDAPGGKLFQGVWLGRGDCKLVLDYRANEIWRPFEDLEVRATGKRWRPDREVQAINATHFTVERLEVADRAQARRFFAIGPEREVVGRLVTVAGEPGSKAEGSTILYLEAGGRRYEVAGGATPHRMPPPDNTTSETAPDNTTDTSTRASGSDRAVAPAAPRDVTAIVRDVEINRAWAATRGGPFVWILRIR